jgi:hypothetical protein
MGRYLSKHARTSVWTGIYPSDTPSWPQILLIEIFRQSEIGQIPAFHLWNCSYHREEDLDSLLGTKIPSGLGKALAGMWVQTFHTKGKLKAIQSRLNADIEGACCYGSHDER